MRLGVSSAVASTPTGVFSQRFEVLFPHTEALGCEVCHPVHQLLHCSQLQLCPPCSTIRSPCWVHQLPPRRESSPPSCLSLPLLPVWVSVSSLSPWFSDFHTVRFSVSSCFLFLNRCCPFGCTRRHSVSTYTSILAGSPTLNVYLPF